MSTAYDKYIDLVVATTAYKILERDAHGNLGHAYLLVSPDRLALDILCDVFIAERFGGRDAYGRVANGLVADVLRLPEEGDKVLVRDVDYLTDTAYVTPAEGERKFYVVSNAETMNEAAQNKLLKTLESPPDVTVIVLKSASGENMLPTVRSRCKTVELKQFPSDALHDALKNYYPDDARLALSVACSEGRLSKAEKMLSDPQYYKLFEFTVSMLKNMRRSSDVAHYAGQLVAEKAYLADVLDYIEILLRDCLAVQSGKSNLVACAPWLHDIRLLAVTFNTDAILGILPLIGNARSRLKFNGNVNGVIDELLFNLLEEKYKHSK